MALKEGSTEAETPALKKLKEDLMKHWDLGDDSNQRSLVCDGAFSYGHFLRRIMSSEHHDFCRNHAGILFDARISDDSRSESQSSLKLDISRFVLHVEGENELVDIIMKSNQDATDKWMQMGQKKQPEHLLQLLKQSNSQGFKGVQDFDSY
ncbi:hypothetical protein WN944_013599 [Citrus x changshan-huyou]|uniref:Uncharacterized protein n=1 Tax=Citrus x changshan-huyou TaxID=2935761 RepID=A0AAP0M901_9ROSI